MRYIDTLAVRGRSHVVTVYEIFDNDEADILALKHQSRRDFESAVSLYRNGKYLESLALFDQLIQFNKNDLPALQWREIVVNAMQARASH